MKMRKILIDHLERKLQKHIIVYVHISLLQQSNINLNKNFQLSKLIFYSYSGWLTEEETSTQWN